MFNKLEFEQWCAQLALSDTARALIERIRASPPSRKVRGGASNVTEAYPSRKMGVTLQFESRTVELAAIYTYEHDSEVLEYYDQPPAIKLVYTDRNDRSIGVLHTPDFFVIRPNGATWEEWKPAEALPPLAQKMPHRYVLNSKTNLWHCPLVNASLASLVSTTEFAQQQKYQEPTDETLFSWKTTTAALVPSMNKSQPYSSLLPLPNQAFQGCNCCPWPKLSKLEPQLTVMT